MIGLLLLFAVTEQNLFAQTEKQSKSAADMELNGFNISVYDSTLQIQNAPVSSTLEIYNVLGVKVASYQIDSTNKKIELSLAKGCYILKIGSLVRKIAIK